MFLVILVVHCIWPVLVCYRSVPMTSVVYRKERCSDFQLLW